MENTLENKERFFVQYWGVRCFLFDDSDTHPFLVNSGQMCGGGMSKNHKLLLKSPADLTDEEAIAVSNLWGSKVPSRIIGRSLVFRLVGVVDTEMQLRNVGAVVDYLRSKGYAMDFNGITINQMVDWGWIKLKK